MPLLLNALLCDARTLTTFRGCFALALDALFLKVLTMAYFTQDAILLYFAGKPAQQAFKALITTRHHIGHTLHPLLVSITVV